MELTIAALVMLVGLLLWIIDVPAKLAELGRIMFFVGLLVLLLNVGGVVNLFPTGR